MTSQLLVPIIIVIISNLIYHNVSKNTPSDVNTFLSLTVTYLVAAAASIILYFIIKRPVNIVKDFQKINWTSYILGLSIVGVEIGYIYMYRAGWQISKGSLVASVAVAGLLIFMGVLFYKENISLKQLMGIACCVIGLILINTK